MIRRTERIAMEFPPLSDPDPDGASVVQELLGGKFGEMSTFMNYTFQSFNFRARQSARPFFDLVSNIAAEEFGHIEAVSACINHMLTGASATSGVDPTTSPMGALKSTRNAQAYIVGGHGTLVGDSMGNPWTGANVFSSGDLIEDLTHNYFLETGARSQKLRVYETVDHPAARALTGYLLIRGGVHQVAYARALENLTGAQLDKLFPSPRIPTELIPECKPYLDAKENTKLYTFSDGEYAELRAVFNGNHPETGDPLEVVDHPPAGFPPMDLPAQPAGWAPDYAPEEIAEIAKRLRVAAGLGDEPTGEVV